MVFKIKSKRPTKAQAYQLADKVLENWSGSEQDLIKVASKQKKPISSSADTYRLAKKEIAEELIKSPELFKETKEKLKK
jgi:hypothetical protein